MLKKLREEIFQFLIDNDLARDLGAEELASKDEAVRSDDEIRRVLGGSRGTTCSGNHGMATGVVGECKYLTWDFNHELMFEVEKEAIPAFEFELRGEDPYFLNGYLADDSEFGEHYNALVESNDQLNQDMYVLTQEFAYEREYREKEIDELHDLLDKAEVEAALYFDELNQQKPAVFPYVNWTRANKSKAWYKDVDWSAIPFNHLNDDEKEKLDWSKINYTEANKNDSFDPALIDWSDISGANKAHQIKAYKAIDWASVDFTVLDEGDKESIDWTKVNYAKAQANEEFDIFSLDWDFLNQLSTQSKKKVYQKVAWNKVDFSAGDSSAFDWSAINLKKAMASDTFTLDVVDINETKQTKNFKRLSAALKKSSADDLLGGASDETLQAIGYQNFIGKIGDSLIQDFTTTSHNYSMILKPLTYTRASAVANAMGGSLAPQATGDSYDDELVDGIQLLASNKQIARKLSSSQADDRSLAWLEAKSGEDNKLAYSALDLQSFDQYTGNEESPLRSDSELWFIVNLGAKEVSAGEII